MADRRKTFSAPAIETLFLLVLSILAMESADSIRSLYRHFLSGITKKSLNAFYYACSYAKADYSRFMNVTAVLSLKLIPEKLQSQPVFLCKESKLELAASMIRQVMPEFSGRKNVIILCDSWYVKRFQGRRRQVRKDLIVPVFKNFLYFAVYFIKIIL